MSIYPVWTATASVYPDWIGIIGRLVNGDVIVLRDESRLRRLDLETLLFELPPELREMLLAPEPAILRFSPETRLLPLPPEPRLERRPKGITS